MNSCIAGYQESGPSFIFLTPYALSFPPLPLFAVALLICVTSTHPSSHRLNSPAPLVWSIPPPHTPPADGCSSHSPENLYLIPAAIVL